MEKLKNEVTIRLVADDFGLLVRNGIDLICPLIPPMPFRQQKQSSILGGQGQEEIIMQKSACNSGCPLFQINDDNTVDICCGSTKVTHKIEKILTIEEQMGKRPDNVMNLKIEKGDNKNVN